MQAKLRNRTWYQCSLFRETLNLLIVLSVSQPLFYEKDFNLESNPNKNRLPLHAFWLFISLVLILVNTSHQTRFMGDGDYLCESTSAGNNVLLYLKQNKGSWHEKDNAMDGALDIWLDLLNDASMSLKECFLRLL